MKRSGRDLEKGESILPESVLEYSRVKDISEEKE